MDDKASIVLKDVLGLENTGEGVWVCTKTRSVYMTDYDSCAMELLIRWVQRGNGNRQFSVTYRHDTEMHYKIEVHDKTIVLDHYMRHPEVSVAKTAMTATIDALYLMHVQPERKAEKS